MLAKASGVRSYTQTMKWVMAAACVLLVLVISLFFLRSTPRSLADGGCMVGNAPGLYQSVQVCFPGPSNDWWVFYRTGRDNCMKNRRAELAKLLNSKPTPVAVARAYSREAALWISPITARGGRLRLRAAAYDGCLQALRGA